eukprot:2610877-Alexandrium_andersonii.AAC.1
MRIKDVSSRARIVEAQSMSEVLENQGFDPKGIGSEAQKGSRAQRVAPSASAARAPQLFPATHLEGSPREAGSCGISLGRGVASVAR